MNYNPLSHWVLAPNPQWTNAGFGPLNSDCRVECELGIDPVKHGSLLIQWKIWEPESYFRCEVNSDQGSVWQDSCVELFFYCSPSKQDYLNLECNARGYCHVARGPNRHQRTLLSLVELAQIQRSPLTPFLQDDWRWGLQVELPFHLLGFTPTRENALWGNVQKCGDETQTPHWMTAFPINTPKPDFHRPEFFRPLWS